jgi:hypothetical protein
LGLGRKQNDINEGIIKEEDVEFGESNNKYLQFFKEYEKAKIALEYNASVEVAKGIENDKRFSLNVLSRLSPKTWGRKDIRQNIVFMNLQKEGMMQRDGGFDRGELDRYISELEKDDMEGGLLEEETPTALIEEETGGV